LRTRARRLGAAIGAVLAMTAVVPLAADAFILGEWNGKIRQDRESFVAFNVARTDAGVKRVRDVVFGGLDYSCETGPDSETKGVGLLDKFRVRNREFGGRSPAVILGFDPPAKLEGKFKPGRRAAGTIRLRGELDPTGRPGVRCDTGVQRWRANKVQPPG
jgi:hypothetical protein